MFIAVGVNFIIMISLSMFLKTFKCMSTHSHESYCKNHSLKQMTLREITRLNSTPFLIAIAE